MIKEPIRPEAAFIHVMGHAMSIPTPHYLFNTYPEIGNFKFAGADTGRLPLLFEAIDSGIMAAHPFNTNPIAHRDNNGTAQDRAVY